MVFGFVVFGIVIGFFFEKELYLFVGGLISFGVI